MFRGSLYNYIPYSIGLITLLSLMSGCSSDDSIKSDNDKIIGRWQLTEAYISYGGPQEWINVENGDEFVFFESGVFHSTKYTECTTGNFSITDGVLMLQYNCDGFEPVTVNESGFITYNLEFESGYFIVTPTSGPICIEGCSYKYTRR